MKKYIHQWFAVSLLSVFALVSCDKYLNVQPKGVRLLKTVNDYDLWLNNNFIASSVPNELYLLGDNVDNPNIINPPTALNDRVYIWRQQFSDELTAEPAIWKDLYKAIYYFNTVLEGIDEATGGTEEMKKSIKAEALLGRALNYFYLVNVYGKVYNASTADQDLAVPFVTSTDLGGTPTPSRSTVQGIYDHIIADITTALPELPQNNSLNRFRGSIAAGYSILARAHLYMGNYTKAAQNAQLALDNGQNEILDYSTMISPSSIGNLMVRPDAIYARLSTNNFYLPYPTLDFLKTYDTKDLRLNFYFGNLGDYSFTTRGTTRYNAAGVPSTNTAYPNWGTSVAEMRLIMAEAAARANDLPTAINQLDLLRKKRFKSADYVKYNPANPVKEEVLQKVLKERTFEFVFTSMRWFDMRRLNAEGRMSTVNRYDGQNNVIATLPAGSNKYTLQIPIQVLRFNQDWPQNPWDE